MNLNNIALVRNVPEGVIVDVVNIDNEGLTRGEGVEVNGEGRIKGGKAFEDVEATNILNIKKGQNGKGREDM